MVSQIDFFKRFLKKLSASGIRYMVVGSVAAGFHGHPRTTMDIDAVVEGDEETLSKNGLRNWAFMIFGSV